MSFNAKAYICLSELFENLQPNQTHRTLQFMKYYFHYENITMEDTKNMILGSLADAMEQCLIKSNENEKSIIDDYDEIK